MRQRISCFVLILALTLPAAGWARLSTIDPDGQNIDILVEATPGGDVSGRSLFHGFIDWFQTYVLCI